MPTDFTVPPENHPLTPSPAGSLLSLPARTVAHLDFRPGWNELRDRAGHTVLLANGASPRQYRVETDGVNDNIAFDTAADFGDPGAFMITVGMVFRTVSGTRTVAGTGGATAPLLNWAMFLLSGALQGSASDDGTNLNLTSSVANAPAPRANRPIFCTFVNADDGVAPAMFTLVNGDLSAIGTSFLSLNSAEDVLRLGALRGGSNPTSGYFFYASMYVGAFLAIPDAQTLVRKEIQEVGGRIMV